VESEDKNRGIREKALRCYDNFVKDGAFVFNIVHNIHTDVPVENIVAMIDAERNLI